MKSIYNHTYRRLIDMLRSERTRQSITQQQLATFLGVKQGVISKIENHERRIDIIELMAICHALHTPFVKFLEKFDAELSEVIPHTLGHDPDCSNEKGVDWIEKEPSNSDISSSSDQKDQTTPDNNHVVPLFDKVVMKSFITSGVHVPNEVISLLPSIVGHVMSVGEAMDVKVWFNGKPYAARLNNTDVAKHGRVIYHIMWKNELKEALARYYDVPLPLSDWNYTESEKDRIEQNRVFIFGLTSQREFVITPIKTTE